MKTNNMFRTVCIVGGILLYVVSIFGVWRVGTRDAVHKTEELLDYASGDIATSWEVFFHGLLEYSADAAMRNLSAPSVRPVAEMRKAAEGCGLDELYVVDRTGKIVSATESAAMGVGIAAQKDLGEFLALTNAAAGRVNLPFRDSLAVAGRQMLYSGFPFKDGAFVIAGLSEATLAKHLAKTGNDYMSTWQIGESGTFVTSDDRTNRLIFDVYGMEGLQGKTLAEVGADAVLKLGDDTERTYLGPLLGETCYYRNFHYLGLRFVPFVPVSEFTSGAVRTTLVTAAVLLVVFGVFGLALLRISLLTAAAKTRELRDARNRKDMEMARSIQRRLLPSAFPPYPEYADQIDVHAFLYTAKAVGGDFYDFFRVGDDKIVIAMADVCGNGISAAMFMMRAKTAIQSHMNGGLALAETMAKVNDILCSGNDNGMYLTMWVGVCDLKTGEVEFVNAGHNPPLVRRADGSCEWIRDRSGIALAAMEGSSYRTFRMKLAPGDGILVYTDGLIEAQNSRQEFYGAERLERTVRSSDRSLGAKAFCDFIRKDLNAFAMGAEQGDDFTALAFVLKSLTR